MAGGGTDGTGSLRPVRRLRRPGGGTLLRIGLVAVLLGLAVIVLDTPAGCPGPAGPSPGSTPAPTSAATPGGPTAGEREAAGERQPGSLPLPGGLVGVPVRLAEPAALAVLRPGARVDLLVVAAGRTGLLASGALVLDVVGGGDAGDGSSALYLALRPDQAHRAVGQPEGSRFAVVVRG